MASLPLTLSAIVVLLMASAMAENNVLLTGQTLGTDSQLTYKDADFVMQGDCNLVLYNNRRGFQSNTHGKGKNCTLSLDDHGCFIIRQGDRTRVWTSNCYHKAGNYAAVLGPDGEVNIYGPSVWSTPFLPTLATKAPALRNVPLVRNVFFSGQILYDNAKLTSRDYTLVMGDDCDLVLRKAGYTVPIWESRTKNNGKYCFLRLDHRGRLAIRDDTYRIVYASPATSKEGDYVLVLQANGQAVIYGPIVWSTAPNRVKDGEITMVTKE